MAISHSEHRRSDSITMAETTPTNSNKVNDVEKHGRVEGDDKSPKNDVTVDAVWGDVGADGPNYRNLGW